MRIQFHGAAQTVTGSQHLLMINGQRLLLECGLFQGHRKESYHRNHNFPFDPRKVDAVILSHAHIDHSGNLPHLVKKGYRGPIFTTEATAHLSNIMLLDSGHIHESDAVFINKKRKRRGEAPIAPGGGRWYRCRNPWVSGPAADPERRRPPCTPGSPSGATDTEP